MARIRLGGYQFKLQAAWLSLVVMLNFFSMKQVHGYIQDKTPLYERYPQLISNDTDPCVRGLNQVLINMGTQVPQEVMTLSTMHGLNDLGSMEQCQFGTIGDAWSTYSTLKINVTHIPVSLISGLCLPVECTQ